MNRDVSNSKQRQRSQTWNTPDVRAIVLLVHIHIGDYVMICTHAERSHKLQVKWHLTLKGIDSKWSFAFTTDDIVTHQHPVVRTKPIDDLLSFDELRWANVQLGERASQGLRLELPSCRYHPEFLQAPWATWHVSVLAWIQKQWRWSMGTLFHGWWKIYWEPQETTYIQQMNYI